LGTGRVRKASEIRSFYEAREFARSLGLKNENEWKEYCRGKLPGYDPKPTDIPASPKMTYGSLGWLGYMDWLGRPWKKVIRKSAKNFDEARAFARSLGLKNQSQWNDYYKGKYPNLPPKPYNIPKNPHTVYKNQGWRDWPDWLDSSVINRSASRA
jgi:hypothetical protein